MAKKQTTAQKKTEFCPVAKKCGGCQLQNMSYPEQLSYKQAKVIRLLGKFCRVNEIIGMEKPYNYRNKVQAAFGMTRGGKIISGVYQSKSHRIVCIDECRLEDKKADEIIVTIRNMMKHYRMIPYNEDTGYGFLRHVLVKRGFTSGEIMVVLVTGTPMFPGKNAFVKELLRKHPEITTIIQNINREHTSLVLGNAEKVLYGKGTIEDTLCGCVFRISAKSFYQINPVQTEKLYSTAIDYAELTGEETVIDAYCGIGTIGIIAAQKAKEVIAVEVNKDAVFDAKNNARRNDTQNIKFYCDDAGKFMTKMAADGKSADVVFMDPPRAGSDEAFLSSVVTLNPKKVVYVSCNPETQERDLKYLIKNGYKVKKIQPVDMFPHTNHVETVVLLSQRKADTHIDIKLDLSELDITAAETKSTYQEIKDYVLEKYGFKVSTLYISQVKAKCGIIERECYNKGEGKSRVPQCPKEKEEAIMDAMRHFRMV
ncbi:MAG: 23S rRNA (uracil(1939)-C(5))-methyltransferase RlmD [Acutalibacteraceae bacterium]|nr:23S rRNA (uracil(1939)-C(5))-methyltransferase RlmD [Acutalibacteraceae bacterium]